MPSETKYSVETRYTTRKALVEKLQKIFPSASVADFGITVSSHREMQRLCVTYAIDYSTVYCADKPL